MLGSDNGYESGSQPSVKHRTRSGVPFTGPLWAPNQSHQLKQPKVNDLRKKGIVLQDTTTLSSVKLATEKLNRDDSECDSHGCCIVYSASNKCYFLLYRRGHQKTSFALANVELEWDVSRCAQCRCLTRLGIEQNFLDEKWNIQSEEQAVDILNYPYDHSQDKIIDIKNFCVFYIASKQTHFVLWMKNAKEQAAAYCEILGEPQAAAPTAGWNLRRLFFGGSAEVPEPDQEKESQFKSDTLIAIINKPLKEHYEVVKELGAGAQGTTRLVKQKKSPEALFVAKESNDHSKDAQKAFLQEFERMKALRHPNCLKVFELIRSEKHNYIITEYAPGGDLFHYMRAMREHDEVLSERKLAKMFKDAMMGVAHLHAEGFIHNDLKPENILVMNAHSKDNVTSPRLVVADFGCMTVQADKAKIFFGDPRYLCPEAMSAMMKHLEGKKIATTFMTTKVDIWAMGATIYEVFASGALPFIYRKCSLETDLAGIYSELLAQVTDLGIEVSFENENIPNNSFSPESRQLLQRMLAKKPELRCHANEILADPWWENGTESPAASGILDNIRFADTRNRVRQILRNAVTAKLCYENMQHCFEIFQRYDPDKSGTISRSEFLQACKELPNVKYDETECNNLFNGADVDKNDSLEFTEFAAVTLDWMKLGHQELDEHLVGLLSRLGSTQSENEWMLDIQSFAKMFQDEFEKSEESGLEEALREIDKNNDGWVSIDELRAFIVGTTVTFTECGSDPLSRNVSMETKASYATALSEPTDSEPLRVRASSIEELLILNPRKATEYLHHGLFVGEDDIDENE